MFAKHTGDMVPTMDELLTCNDDALSSFLTVRSCDAISNEAGRLFYLGCLRAGLSEFQIITALRMTAQGKANPIQLRGLDTRAKDALNHTIKIPDALQENCAR